MKPVCNAVFLVCLVLTATSSQAATKVFLLGGQSNMAGVGAHPTDDPIPAPYDVPQQDVKFWSNNDWVALQSGFGFQPGEFGPEVTFGYRHLRLGECVYGKPDELHRKGGILHLAETS